MNDEEFALFILKTLNESVGGDEADVITRWNECTKEDKKLFAEGAKKIREKANETKAVLSK
jgi:hypothetical protein